MNININLKGIFSGCFPGRSRKVNNKVPLIDFIRSINGHSQESKIQSCLQRLCNGKFDLVILYKNNGNSQQMVSFYGDYDDTKITMYALLNIPIFKDGILMYYVMLMTIKKTLHNYDEGSLDLLKTLLSESSKS